MPRLLRFAPLGLLVVVLLCALLPSVAAAERNARHVPEQKPQAFLIRSSFVKQGVLDPVAHERALRYRAEKYGSVPGMNLERFNPKRAYSNAVNVHFMGLPMQIHKRVAPVLETVERHIRRTCTGPHERYVPRAIGGFRINNTYRGGEISNHLFGIAIDIDPNRNPCCGCVAPWPNSPLCKASSETVYERAALPRCWIDGFERYGFYWLGRDPGLRDTMHFEFLGDPELVGP